MEQQGLTTPQVEKLLKQYGLNQLSRNEGVSALTIYIGQFKNILAYLLIIAALLSFVVSDAVDGILIVFILVINSSLGFWQEYKASKELEALQEMEVDNVRVIRDGEEKQIQAINLVPGDIVIVEAGDKIAADGKIIESISLSINESSLTGESLPVLKSIKGDDNLVFFGTNVTSGRGKFVVTSTGSNTKFGIISVNLSQVKDETTPLEKSLEKFAKTATFLVFGIVLVIFLIRITQGYDPVDMIVPSIALLVAAVPEGLPTVVTVVLAMAVHKMYAKKALVRRMVAVESLGATTVICTDKTGTLTQNKMVVKSVESYSPATLDDLLKCAVLCNSANLVLKEDGGSFDILGDTTEGALLLWALDKKINIEQMRSEGKLIEEIPFSLEKRMMTVVWENKGREIYSKGAPEVILQKVDLIEKEVEQWKDKYQQMSQQGLRVLGFCKDKKFLGLIGIADPVRIEVKEALSKTTQAGIKVVMVTGDNGLTAKAIAEEIGLLKEGDEILTGVQLDEITDEELINRLDKIRIFARIEPVQKFRIVKALQAKGEIVAVTGDGVNDSLALKQAQVGVAMGITGTDVAKESSDIILTDDNFATLVSAVEQGRLSYSNILKVVKFLLTGNFSEILLLSLAAVFGLPTPLLPSQILWMNFVTDGLPALALGFDNASPNLMKNPPRSGNNILDFKMIKYVMIGALLIVTICLGSFWVSLSLYGITTARATVFTVMVIVQMILPFVIRRHHSLFSNKKLLLSVCAVLLMQFLILNIPLLKTIFKI